MVLMWVSGWTRTSPVLDLPSSSVILPGKGAIDTFPALELDSSHRQEQEETIQMALCPILKGECSGSECEWWYERAGTCTIRMAPNSYLVTSDTAEEALVENATPDREE